jgi:uncharacterized membrane protein
VSQDKRSLVLGVVVAPGLAEEVTARIASELDEDLAGSHHEVGWRTEFVVDRLATPPALTTELVDSARRELLARDWDLALVITDLPLRLGSRPVQRHVSRTHGVALVSLPALGPLRLARRLRRTLHELVGELVGEDQGLLSADAVVGNLRLLVGMVRANRPWRLAAQLYGVLAAALAVSVFGAVTSDVWRLAAAMGWGRLAALALASTAVTIVAVIAAHELWERAPDPRVREQVLLFNVATALTVTIGIVTLYLALFVVVLGGAELVVPKPPLADALGRPVGWVDYVKLAWFIASFATIGGALGTALESDAVAREAAYAGRPAVAAAHRPGV